MTTESITQTESYGARVWRDSQADQYLSDVSSFSGRLAGSPAADATREYLVQRMESFGASVSRWTFPFTGFAPISAHLSITVNGHDRFLEATALPNSPSLPRQKLRVVDLGRGTLQDFEAAGGLVAGAAVLVSHEFPFSTGHIHRWVKYQAAKDAGAVLFLIANNNRGIGTVVGSSGRNLPDDIPALGISYEAGREIARQSAFNEVQLEAEVVTEARSWVGENIIAEFPGETDEWVVLSAHYDGHAVSENALDNGTGLAVVLDAARILSTRVSGWKRGLRVMFFTFEEWGLYGSQVYVESLTQTERDTISIDINLDTVAGHAQLNALTGANLGVEALVRGVSRATRVPVIPVRPVRSNSDHYSFQSNGIPALRLIAGYEEPEESLTRFLLTPADTIDMVDPAQLRVAEIVTLEMVEAACTGPRIERAE